jgi:parvulin-like peptidyl-prolyl isomerase
LLKTISKKRLLTAGGIALLIIAIIISFGFWLYSSPIGNPKIKVFKQLNLPVAKAGSGLIGGRELFSRYEIAALLYGSEKGFQATQTQSDILDRLIEIKKLESVAGSLGISISAEEVKTEYDRIAGQEGGAEKFEKMLSDQYHFTPDQFRQKSLAPDVLKTKLAISFYNDKTLNSALYKTLEIVNSKLAQNPATFSDLAKTYSEDPATSKFGGDSGDIPNADLAPEFQEALKDAQPEQVVTVTTRFGIYVVKVVNRKDDSVAGGSIHFQSILLNYGKIDPKITESAFTKWYNGQTNNIKVKKYINL